MGYYQAGDYYRRGDLAALARGAGAVLAKGGRVLGTGAAAAGTAATLYEAYKGLTAGGGAAAPAGAGMGASSAGVAPTMRLGGRRMNVANIRALRRSLRRIAGFARVARKVMVFARPSRGKTGFKFHRRRKR